MSGGTNFWIRWRVRAGYPVAVAAFLFARPRANWILAGVVIAAVGLAMRAYAAGYLHKHSQLATSGPYAYTRNPLYLGSIFLALGFSVASHSWISAILLAAYLLIFYPVVIRREQAELTKLYGPAFVEYAKRVPVFWPRISPAQISSDEEDSQSEKFSWSQYLKNREYEAAIGFALAITVLCVLMVLGW